MNSQSAANVRRAVAHADFISRLIDNLARSYTEDGFDPAVAHAMACESILVGDRADVWSNDHA